jgi:hypothetical protein
MQENSKISFRSLWGTPQGDAELMSEQQVLGFQPEPRLEQVEDEHSEGVQDRQHRH